MAIAAQNNGLGGGRPGEGAGIANLLFVIPALTLYALFVLWPLASSLYYSLTDWDGIGAPRWVGLANFARAFRDDIHLASYIHVTLYILGTLVFEVSFGLVMAVMLNSDRPGFALLRGLFFSPVVLSMSAAGVLWNFVFDYRSGLINRPVGAVAPDQGRGRCAAVRGADAARRAHVHGEGEGHAGDRGRRAAGQHRPCRHA